ncbi:methyltransferase domain-containing protein [Candidatus Uhrbacteria bacterium]|nr:methyltransferase domain-containing protein [Candidatus Uhrbacteria bacterium]
MYVVRLPTVGWIYDIYHMFWLTKFFKAPKTIGSIAPSSNSLGHLMVKNLPFNAKTLELGPGTGAITTHITAKLSDPSLLTCAESDSQLAAICQNKFPNITVLNQDIQQILNSNHSFDAIISGIPFAAMKPKHRNQLFHLIHQRLTPGGTFTMFQYSMLTRQELRNIFGKLTTDFTLFNLPPAFVFTCRKQQ